MRATRGRSFEAVLRGERGGLFAGGEGLRLERRDGGAGDALGAVDLGDAQAELLVDDHDLATGDGAAVDQQVGGAVGVALLGSVLNSGYRSSVSDAVVGLPAEAAGAVEGGIGQALFVSEQMGPQGDGIAESARNAFVDGWHGSMWIAAGIAGLTLVYLLVTRPPRGAADAMPVLSVEERLDGQLFSARRIAYDAHDDAGDAGVLLSERRLEIEGNALDAVLDRFAAWCVHNLIDVGG